MSVLNWFVRLYYTSALGALAYEFLVVQPENALVASTDDTRLGRSPSCVVAIVIVFATYLIFHNALGLTNTRVYWIQVAISVLWTVFLTLLLTGSAACPSVWYHVDNAFAYCGFADEYQTLQGAAKEWFVFLFVPQVGSANLLDAPPPLDEGPGVSR